METREWTYVDKAAWGPGPWQSEPDKRQWTDACTGLPCLIVRGPSGALCGYVGVPEGHTFFQVDYDDVAVHPPHGGLTFSDFCSPGKPEHGICHVAGAGDDPRPWWLGFDCAHAGDLMPSYDLSARQTFSDGYLSYKDAAYVAAECAKLARALATGAPANV